MKIFNFTFLDRLSAEQHEKLDNLYYYSSKSIQTKDLFAEINNSLKLLKQRINTNLRTRFSNSDEEEQNEMEPKFKRNVVVPNSDRQNNIVVKLSEGFNNYLQNNKAKEILMSYKQSLCYYSGESILREICMLEAQRDIDKWIIRIVAIVRVLLILGIQFRTPGLVTTINAGDCILYVLLILISKENYFICECCAHCLTLINKDENFIHAHFLPTLDITDHNNLLRWIVLRSACLDFGKKYTSRIFLYCSGFIGFYGSIALIQSIYII